MSDTVKTCTHGDYGQPCGLSACWLCHSAMSDIDTAQPQTPPDIQPDIDPTPIRAAPAITPPDHTELIQTRHTIIEQLCKDLGREPPPREPEPDTDTGKARYSARLADIITALTAEPKDSNTADPPPADMDSDSIEPKDHKDSKESLWEISDTEREGNYDRLKEISGKESSTTQTTKTPDTESSMQVEYEQRIMQLAKALKISTPDISPTMSLSEVKTIHDKLEKALSDKQYTEVKTQREKNILAKISKYSKLMNRPKPTIDPRPDTEPELTNYVYQLESIAYELQAEYEQHKADLSKYHSTTAPAPQNPAPTEPDHTTQSTAPDTAPAEIESRPQLDTEQDPEPEPSTPIEPPIEPPAEPDPDSKENKDSDSEPDPKDTESRTTPPIGAPPTIQTISQYRHEQKTKHNKQRARRIGEFMVQLKSQDTIRHESLDMFIDFFLADSGCMIDEYDNLYVVDGHEIYHKRHAKDLKAAIGRVIRQKYQNFRRLLTPNDMRILAELVRERSVSVSQLDTCDMLPFANCMVGIRKSLETGRHEVFARPHDRKYLCTHRLAVAYEPDKSCPDFIKYLETELFAELAESNREQTIDMIRQCIGLCLFPHMGNQRTFWFLGIGGAGKGSIFKLIQAIVDMYCSNVPFSKWAGLMRTHFATNTMAGKRCNIDDDVGKNIKTDYEELRRMSSKAVINHEGKGKDPEESIFNITLVFGANKMPQAEYDKAFCRRIQPILIEYEPEKEIGQFHERFYPELSGIVNWALKRVVDVYDNNGIVINHTPHDIVKLILDSMAGNILDIAAHNLFEKTPRHSESWLPFENIQSEIVKYLENNHDMDIEKAMSYANKTALGRVELIAKSKVHLMAGNMYYLKLKSRMD